jgi:hypothetical protein
LSRSPYDAHYAGDHSCHAEGEEHPTDQEFVVLFAVLLEDCHVCGGQAKVNDHEDGCDRNIDCKAWDSANACCVWRVWCAKWHSVHAVCCHC